MSFFDNTRKPTGWKGKIAVSMMNIGHSPISKWGLSFLKPTIGEDILDCGCGGGANIKRLLKMCPNSVVKGIDYSNISVRKARKLNKKAIFSGRCYVEEGIVENLPYNSDSFDTITAFEIIYFFSDLALCFREIYRVLKKNGTFLICNEFSGEIKRQYKWTEIIDGMRIYKGADIKQCLERCGFREIIIHKNKKGWICITAQK